MSRKKTVKEEMKMLHVLAHVGLSGRLPLAMATAENSLKEPFSAYVAR